MISGLTVHLYYQTDIKILRDGNQLTVPLLRFSLVDTRLLYMSGACGQLIFQAWLKLRNAPNVYALFE